MNPITNAYRVQVKYGKDTTPISVPAPYDLRSLRLKIEDELSVPQAQQKLISSGKQLQGVAFPDDTRVADCVKSDGVIMLMAPPGASKKEEVDACEAMCEEVFSGKTKDRRVVEDILTKACEKLDSLSLVGKQRMRRKLLVERIDKMSQR